MPSPRASLTASMVAGAFAAAFGVGVPAQTKPPALPLENLGVEHLDIVVPDPAASARFYTRVFKTVLHQQQLRDSLRYFVLLGDLPPDRQVGYIAIGAATQGRSPSIGHYCVLAKGYDRASVAGALESAGFSAARPGAGALGMWPDPDGLELQLFQPPAGLVTAAVRSPLLIDGDGMITPLGVDHVILLVSSLERSLLYYRLVYGAAAEGPRDSNGRVWFNLQRDTRIGLQQIPDGRAPMIGHFAIRVAPFDRAAFTARLRELAVNILPSGDEPDVVRFEDNNRIIVELRVAR